MKAKKFLWLVLVLAFAFSLAAFVACDDDEGETATGGTVAVTAVSLDHTSVTLLEGEDITLVATVTPDNATDKTVTWTTSDEDVATVSGGVVTAVARGEATITASAGDKSASCVVTVEDGMTAATLSEWVSDRTEPEAFDVDETDGTITLTTKTEPANNWYAWQGRKAAVEMDVTDSWKVTTTIDLSESVFARTGTRSSIWLNVQDENGDTVDWAILQYYAYTDDTDDTIVRAWQYWDSSDDGAWLDIETVQPTQGEHDLTIAFADGTISMYIDGVKVAEYAYTDVTECKVAEVIVQSYSFGESYTVTWGIPEVRYTASDSAAE